MSQHLATIRWTRSGPDFLKGQYSREHHWAFDGGLTLPASPSPSIVPPPWSNPAHLDPEEAFVAAVASCHMLTFLHIASRHGFQVESYQDEAIGHLAKNPQGQLWISTVTLHPRILYSAAKNPTPEETQHLHHQAHEQCFIANSVRTQITIA